MDQAAPPLHSLHPDYFRNLYDQNSDPWNFETSPYEAAKYTATLRSLPRSIYPSAFEVGCSVGVLTAQLAARCGSLLSIDVSEKALKRAADRCKDLPNVRFEHMQFPHQQPAAQFDLIVVSEVAYYWSNRDLQRAMDVLASLHMPGGHLILVHWTPPVSDYPQTGDRVHDLWVARSDYRRVDHLRQNTFRLDVLERIG